MTSREKGMLVILLLGGLGAGGFVAYDEYMKMITSSVPGKPADQIVQEVRTRLDSAKMDEARMKASVAASETIGRDFLQAMPKWLEDLYRVKDVKKDDLQYTGYLAGVKILAIIGGTEYATGDLVEGTNFTVKSVLPDHVLLVAADGEETQLPYQGEELLF